MRLGLREANQRFSKAMKAVRDGEEVVLTERGRPIAVIKPLPAADGADAALRRLEAAGLLRRALKHRHLAPFRPRRIKGAPLARTIREGRDEE